MHFLSHSPKFSERMPIIFFLFILSGFCGLTYQVVWARKALAAFGAITPVLSVVISVFMLGLSLGSWLGGKWAEKWRRWTKTSPIVSYGISELLIGIGAFVTPVLFNSAENYLIVVGATDSIRYLLLSAILISASILPWCFFMGMTYPLMMAFLREIDYGNTTTFSYLYLANVIGAIFGAAITAAVLIELLGFANTLKIAGICNFLIALVSFCLAYNYNVSSATEKMSEHLASRKLSANEILLVYSTLFLTGFCSMAMEVVWIRAFTPILSTTIYSFALILTVYLCSTWLGSYRYRRHVCLNRVFRLESLIALAIFFSILPLVVTDPRLGGIGAVGVVFGIFPFCALLGYMTPFLIDYSTSGSPMLAGKVYAVNIIGCIFGPLFAGYILLPVAGVKSSFVLLSIPFVILFLLSLKVLFSFGNKEILLGISGVAMIVFASFFSISYEEGPAHKNAQIRRDYVATVISSGDGMEKRLYVNGIGMTRLTPATKMMAHIPLVFLGRPPQNALIICLGMGTTFRSLMSWDIDVKAVELVPSVKEAFPYYFKDATRILQNPRGNIIVDDGRRYLRRTSEMFDVITIDPPPPAEAAGTSMLYSIEFYSLVKAKLREDGIVQQWWYAGEKRILEAVVRSLFLSFPYVKIFGSVDGWGYHFLASRKPINIPKMEMFLARMPYDARVDFMEWYPDKKIEGVIDLILSKEQRAETYLSKNEEIFISDDRPYNEYFLLRRWLNFLKKQD